MLNKTIFIFYVILKYQGPCQMWAQELEKQERSQQLKAGELAFIAASLLVPASPSVSLETDTGQVKTR